MKNSKPKGMFIVDEESWEYIYKGEEPAPPFPSRLAFRIYLTRGGLREFPKRLYNVFKRFLTCSLYFTQVSAENTGNTNDGKPGTSLQSKETL